MASLLEIAAVVIIAVVALKMHWFQDSRTSDEFVKRPNDTYDYIVVGAGAAGSVVAGRLSENSDITVLLLEAGGDEREFPEISVPASCFMNLKNTESYVKNYFTEPSNIYSSYVNGQSLWPRGKVMGGSGSINFMAYVRGSRYDYDRWADYVGDSAWSYSNVLPYFRRSENMADPELAMSVYHGNDGPCGTKVNTPEYELTNVFMEGLTELGYKYNKDFNGKTIGGFSPSQQMTSNGERSSTARGLIYPALGRKNLHVAINARVQKVVVEKEDGKVKGSSKSEGVHAKGVNVVINGRKFYVKARNEVIVSAGAVESPKILMLSGIGPKKHLDELGIQTLVDLPVGENLQDHLMFDTPVSVKEKLAPSPEDLMSTQSLLQYKLFSSGPLTKLGELVFFVNSRPKETNEADWPDLQFFILPVVIPTSMFPMLYNYKPELISQMSPRDNLTNGWTCFSFLLRPESRGVIKLKSVDPYDDPAIYPNYYDKQEDLDTMLRGVDICKKLISSKALRNVGSKMVEDAPMSSCKQYAYGSRNYWACVVKSRPNTTYHPVGTCKMGPSNDPTTVVDSKLRVKGVKGLRIADASIMPYIVSANTYTASVLIGEKASDFILGKKMDPFIET